MSELICEKCNIKDCECVPYDVECDSCIRAYKQGYEKAIDDAVKVIEDSKSIFDNSRSSSMSDKCKLQNLIKKLKEGGV